jgi:uncharacterized RDD family membrane protein YckC
MAVAMGSSSLRIMAVAMGPSPLAWHPLSVSLPLAHYAGFWRRFLASLIDGILVSTALYYLNLLLNLILGRVTEVGDAEEDLYRALAVWLTVSFALCIVLNWLYYAVMESSPWQATLGKRALGMAVTDLAGDRISFGRATGRLFARFNSGLLLWL